MRFVPTVRARITALATLAVLVVLVVAGIGLVGQQRRLLTAALDEVLIEQADALAAVDGPRDPTIPPLGEDDALAQVVQDGRVVAATATVAGHPPVLRAPIEPGRHARTVGELPHEDGRFRVLTVVAGAETILVAGSLDDIDESASTLVRSLAAAIPVVAVVLAGVLWWLTGRALRPVEEIRAEVATIGGNRLDRRVPVPPGDDEVARLARTMNDMLERVDQAARRQQQFVADASHEPRGPIARMRAELEVDLAAPTLGDPQATHRSVLEEAVGLQRLADDLLLVARLDDGSPSSSRRDRLDLDDVVLRVVRRLQADARVEVDVHAVSAGQVLGDRGELTRLVGNLADNAVRHASRQVAFGLAEVDGQAVLTVTDDGDGVPEVDRERIFDRFARVDGARSSAAGCAGLGLAIARDIAERHGGSLLLDPAHQGGARFVLRLPAAP